MPLHDGMKWPEVREILEHSGAEVLVASRALADLHLRELAGLPLTRICVIDPDVALLPVSPIPSSEGAPEFGRGREAAGPPAPRAHPKRPAESSHDRLALVLHTSGSHGHAKGVMLSRGNLEHILEYRLAHTCLTAQSVSIVASCLTQSC